MKKIRRIISNLMLGVKERKEMNENILSWQAAPSHPVLQNNEVHLWCADLNVSENTHKMLVKYLNNDELNRAARFVREQDRSHFIAARGILRDILNRYINLAPENIEFNYGEHGKPSLNPRQNQCNINFNLAHSQDLAIYAITRLNNLGVDIEYTKRNIEALDIAERFFSKNEIASMHVLSASEQVAAFYRIWTRKEAFVKAIGVGLSHPLDQFSVDGSLEKSAINFHTENPSIKNDWYVYSITITNEYVAALSLEERNISMLKWHWQCAS